MSYKIQIDDTIREATSAEAARIEAQRADAAAQAAALDAKVAALVSARTKLAALGLTEAEVAALLGG